MTASAETMCSQMFQGEASAAGVPDSDMQKMVEMIYDMSQMTAPDQTAQLLTETHKLDEYLYKDESKNLAMQSPFDVMNAAQRMLAIIYSQGHSKVRLEMTGEEVDFYPFFSSGLPITKGYRIVDNEKAIAEIVDNLRSQAMGDRSGVSIVMLVGGAATGKSETLKLLGLGAENQTSSQDHKYAVHTFTWTNLDEIPSLHRFIPVTESNGKMVRANIDAPLGDSPFTLLPAEIQELLLKQAGKEAERLLEGMTPTPVTRPDPISSFIRNEIIQHYSRQFGHVLTPPEIVAVLNKHVIVKRQVMGQSFGNMPVITNQGNSWDAQGLFMAPNPVVKFAAGPDVGPSHPMAWYINGKILKGHGNAVLFDEFLRNPKDFRDMLLSAFESRVLTINGAPSVSFDAVMIAASNTANLDETLSEGAQNGTGTQGTGYAAVSRFRITPMRYSILPAKVAQLLLNGKIVSLYQQSLTEENAPITKGSIDQLLPRRQSLSKVETPDYRYRMWFGEGADKVMVAPHALMLMSEIIAATRIQTSVEKAEKVHHGKILTSNLFRNPIDRISLFEGSVPNVQPDEIRELNELSYLLKEGEFGIDNRDAGRWLTAAIAAARGTKNADNTVTPGIVLKTFRAGLIEGWIHVTTNKIRMDWLSLADEVASQLLLPRLDADISRALANGDRVVKDAYFDILDEMIARAQDENARVFTSSLNGQERPIDDGRFAAIREIYKKKNGRELNISQIAMFHSRQLAVGKGTGFVPDESLLDAVASYYSQLHTQLAGLEAIVEFERTGSGSDEVRNAHSSLVSAMTAMGYNMVAIRDALMLVRNYRSQSQAQ